jgi:hypothetical protein
MHKYEKKILEAELSKGTPCELKHGESSLAVNYITCDIGYTGQRKYSFVIPICKDCEASLASPEWILMYCLKCSDNQWLYKPMGRLDYYDKHILWTSCCPQCIEPGEQVRIFFND